MPTYSHICENTECNNEWDDFYSMSQEPPKVCPVCNKETAKRVLSSGGSKGVVELYGNELVDKIKSDTVQLKKDMHKDENIYANMLGQDKYQAMQVKLDDQKRIRRK